MDLLPSRAGVLSGLVMGLLLLLPGGLTHAQSNGDGSIYSRLGLGSLQEFSSSQAQAMGGGGYALRSLNYNPTSNPALWSDQVYTRIAVGATYETVDATNNAGASSQLAAGTVEGIQFSFPIYDRKLGVGLSFQPFSQHNYRTSQSSSIPLQVRPPDGSDDGIETVPYDVDFRGSGGLHEIRGGIGYRVNDRLRVGASINGIFGILERRRNTDVADNQDNGIRDLRLNDATRLSGVSGTVGAHLALADVLQEDDALSLGAAVSLPTTLEGPRSLTISERRSVSADTITAPNGARSVDGSVSLPWRGRFGVAYQPDERWTLTADGLYEPWSNFSSSFPTRAPFTRQFPIGGEETLTDRWRVSTGFEVVPAGDDQFAGYFRRIAYRLGGYTEQLYVQPDGETSLQTYALTGGISLPTSLSGTRIDLNVHAGTRGTTDNALVQDRFYGVSLHVNFGEEWFQRRKLR